MAEPKINTPLPKLEITALAVTRIANNVAFNGYFAFAPYLVRQSLGDEASVSGVALWVGIIGSVFGFTQFLGGIGWGWASDRIGRVPVMLFSTLCSVVFLTAFGVSTNIYWLIFMRALNGITNGSHGITQTYATEVTDSTNRTLATSILSGSWGVGNVIGPAVCLAVQNSILYLVHF